MPAKTWNALATRRPVLVKELHFPADVRFLFGELPDDPGTFEAVGSVAAIQSLPTWEVRWQAFEQAAGAWSGA
jgi:hypothetical protein